MLRLSPFRAKHFILRYTYVPNILTARTPHRPAHIAVLSDLAKRGLVFAGAYTNPVDSAEFMFEGEDDSLAKEFIQRDPYMQNKLVPQHSIREILVVAGRITEKQ